ncbi:MAG: hypothetical protein HC923_09125 [Myxococcales bacterium]|nr:hypothetical protein [Myxococcales bacterium]
MTALIEHGARVEASLQDDDTTIALIDPTDYSGSWPPEHVAAVSTVSLIGRGLAYDGVERAGLALAARRIPVLARWTQAERTTFVISPSAVEEAARELHAFVGLGG